MSYLGQWSTMVKHGKSNSKILFWWDTLTLPHVLIKFKNWEDLHNLNIIPVNNQLFKLFSILNILKEKKTLWLKLLLFPLNYLRYAVHERSTSCQSEYPWIYYGRYTLSIICVKITLVDSISFHHMSLLSPPVCIQDGLICITFRMDVTWPKFISWKVLHLGSWVSCTCSSSYRAHCLL